jgi:membrane protein DedA with SNARE-associated domain
VDFISHISQHISPPLIYVLVGAFLFLESTGIPLINTTLLLFVGAIAFDGRLNIILLIVVAILGSILGACCSYSLGRFYGEPLLIRLTHLLHIDQRKVLLTQRWFQTAGLRMVFVSRIVPYIRPFSCFPAGMAAMPFRRFFFSALAGSVIWCITFLIVGWELGPRWKLAMDLVHTYTVPTICALLVLAVLSFFCRRALHRYFKRRLDEQSGGVERDHDLLEV